MKRRIFALILAVLTVFSLCGISMVSAAGSYSFTEDLSKVYEVTKGVQYREFTISSGVYEDTTAPVSVLEFGVDDYAVLSYTGTAGGAATLEKQYALAKADGYDVVAVINGDFFSMDTGSVNGNYGYLNEYLVSGGVVVCADNDNPTSDFDGAVAIGTDGSISSVMDSKLHFGLYLNGKEASGGIAAVNKTGGNKSASNWSDKFYYFDSHSGDKYDEDTIGKALTYAACPGYEILCKKLNGTDLTVNGTLEAEVISVTANTYGGAIGKDQFILFVKNESPFAYEAAALKAGDTVAVTASETNAKATSVTEGAVSVMANVGWLVKDGVNQTLTKTTIGSHSVTLSARWTAFGKKADGSWVFFTSEGGTTGEGKQPTLKDIAQAMIDLGCTDVIRMDGGGSSAMYVCDNGNGVPGYKQSSTRPVGDCILLVRRSSEALKVPAELKEQVSKLAEQAKGLTDDYAKAAYDTAAKVLADDNAVKANYLTAFMKLRYALSGKNQLGDLMTSATAVVFTEYSEYVLQNIREAYAKASAAFGGVADAEKVQAAYDELKKWLDMKGNVTIEGTEYKTVSSGIYLTGMNRSIMADYSCIFTPGMNATKINLNWSQVLLLRWNEEQEAYVLEQNFFGNGQAATIQKKLGFADDIIPDDCIVIGVHGDSPSGQANRKIASNAKTGQVLVLHGIDLDTKTSGIGAYFEFVNPAPKYATGDVNGDGSVDAFDYQMLKAGVLNSYQATDAERARMDVNSDKTVDAFDYQMLKAFVLGTYQF